MQFSNILALVASLGLVAAAPPSVVPRPGVHGDLALSADSGCSSIGPFNNTADTWFILKSFDRTCQATDTTGCLLGDATHILAMEVDDPNDEVNLATAVRTNTLPFVCPSTGMIRCQVDLRSKKFGSKFARASGAESVPKQSEKKKHRAGWSRKALDSVLELKPSSS